MVNMMRLTRAAGLPDVPVAFGSRFGATALNLEVPS